MTQNMQLRRSVTVMFMLLLSGCALGDLPDDAEVSPVTAVPLASPVFGGECDLNPNQLAGWLQTTTILAEEFNTNMNESAALSRTDVPDHLGELIRLRREIANTATPDCAVDTQILLLSTMSEAIAAFEAFVNGSIDDPGSTVVALNSQFDQVGAMQANLMEVLQARFGTG